MGIRRRQTRRATPRLGCHRERGQRIAPRLWASGSEGSEARFALGGRLASGRTVNLTTDARAIGNQRERTQSTKVPRASHWDGDSSSGRRKNVGAYRKVLTSVLSRRRRSFDKFPNSYETTHGGFMRPDKGSISRACQSGEFFLVRLLAISGRNRWTWTLLRSCTPADRMPR